MNYMKKILNIITTVLTVVIVAFALLFVVSQAFPSSFFIFFWSKINFMQIEHLFYQKRKVGQLKGGNVNGKEQEKRSNNERKLKKGL